MLPHSSFPFVLTLTNAGLMTFLSAHTLKYIVNALIDSILVVPVTTHLHTGVFADDDSISNGTETAAPMAEEEEHYHQNHHEESLSEVEYDAQASGHIIHAQQYFRIEETLLSILLPIDGPNELEQMESPAARNRDWIPKTLEATRTVDLRLATDTE